MRLTLCDLMLKARLAHGKPARLSNGSLRGGTFVRPALSGTHRVNSTAGPMQQGENGESRATAFLAARRDRP